jgi:hypothetical protein
VNNKLLQYGLPVLVLLVIFFPLFQANYLYLDDAHQLWFNEKGATMDIWLIHGRYIGGLLMEKAFTSINTIDAVKTYRILSLIGWALAICIYVRAARQWVRYNLMDNRLVLLSAVYLASSLSVAIANGWGGTCFEICLTFTAGLLSGHLLYAQLQKHGRYLAIPIPMQLLVLVLGLVALFTYQIGIGMFLIPFFLHWNNKKFEKPDHFVITGVIAFLVVTVVYYLTFKMMMSVVGEAEGHRANLNLNILSKISFFFGVPTAQAFSFNFLFNLHSIISQAFYILAIAVWVVYSFVTERSKPVLSKIIYIAGTFAFLMLIYLPVMVTIENYSSYRSMLALNLAVFLMLTNMVIQWIKKVSWKTSFAIAAMILFACVGFYNFRINFLNPIVKEYQVVRSYVENQYKPNITKIYFLMPPEDLFKEQYNINHYRDEFGVPSTFKNWVPGNLVKQIIYEMTHNKSIAQRTEVVLYANEEAENFKKQIALKEPNTFSIDMQQLFNANK